MNEIYIDPPNHPWLFLGSPDWQSHQTCRGPGLMDWGAFLRCIEVTQATWGNTMNPSSGPDSGILPFSRTPVLDGVVLGRGLVRMWKDVWEGGGRMHVSGSKHIKKDDCDCTSTTRFEWPVDWFTLEPCFEVLHFWSGWVPSQSPDRILSPSTTCSEHHLNANHIHESQIKNAKTIFSGTTNSPLQTPQFGPYLLIIRDL